MMMVRVPYLELRDTIILFASSSGSDLLFRHFQMYAVDQIKLKYGKWCNNQMRKHLKG